MKKIWIIAVLGIMALASCESKIDLPGDVSEKPVSSAAVFTATTESAATKTTLDDNYNVLWQNGDLITIVDGAGHAGVYETTSTTSQGEFTHSSGEVANTPSYTAYYPSTMYNGGTLTLPAEQTYVAENISGAPMMAVSSTTSLGFKNLTGIIRLNISTTLVGQKVRRITLSADQGMSGAFTVSGNAAVVAGDGDVSLDCGTEGVAINSTAKPFYIAVPASTYTNLNITVETTSGVSQSRKSKSGIEVSRSSITDVTLPFNNLYIDLSETATANSYIVPELGSYKFNATVKGNGYANLAGINTNTDASSIAKAELVWATFGTSTAPAENELIKNIFYQNGYVYFSTGDTFKEGNALIAVKDASDNILWSWHIWVHNYNETYLTGSNGVKMMDRNLGAICTNISSLLSYGMYYQWGRKDPFIGTPDVILGTARAVVDATSTNGVTVGEAILHPTNYYVLNQNTASRWEKGDHWCSDAGKMTLWSESAKTIFDPCPPGWRTPSHSEITGLGFTLNEAAGFAPSGYIETFGVPTDTDGSGGAGTLWKTTNNGTNARIEVVYALLNSNLFRSPDMGFNIRCVKDE